MPYFLSKITNILIHKKIKIAFFYQKTLPESFQEGFSYLWSHLGSNQGPPDYESGFIYFPIVILCYTLLDKQAITKNKHC